MAWPSTLELEACLRTFKEKSSFTPKPRIEQLSALLDSVEYKDRLSLLKYHNALGTIFINLAENGLAEHIRCIIESIEPNDRFDVYRLTDVGSSTLLHRAAYQGNSEVIQIVLSSLSSVRRIQLLQFTDVSGMTALDYAKYNDGKINMAVSAALLKQLNEQQRQELIDRSEVFKKIATKTDMDLLLEDPPLLDLEKTDEAAHLRDKETKWQFLNTTHGTALSLEGIGEVLSAALIEKERENQMLKMVVQRQEEELRAVANEMANVRQTIGDPETGILVQLNGKIAEVNAERESMAEELQSLKKFKAKVVAGNLENKLSEVHDDLESVCTEKCLETRLEQIAQKMHELNCKFEALRALDNGETLPTKAKESKSVTQSASVVASKSHDDSDVHEALKTG